MSSSIRRSLGLGVKGKNYNNLYRNFERQAYLVGEEMAKTILAQRRVEKAEKYIKQLEKNIKNKNNEINRLKRNIIKLSRKKGVKSASPKISTSKRHSKRSRGVVTRRY